MLATMTVSFAINILIVIYLIHPVIGNHKYHDAKSLEYCNKEGFIKKSGASMKCECFEQYFHGLKCEIMRSHCTPKRCRNGGVCKDYIGVATCECPRGFFGGRCEWKHPKAPFVSNPRLALAHRAYENEVYKIFIIFNELQIAKYIHNVSLKVELNVGDKYLTEIVLPEQSKKFKIVNNVKKYFVKLGLPHYDFYHGSAYLHKTLTKFHQDGVYNVTLSLRVVGGSIHYFSRYTVYIIADSKKYFQNIDVDEDSENLLISHTKKLPTSLLQKSRRIADANKLSVGLDCSYRRRNHLINTAETIGTFVSNPNSSVKFRWNLRYAFDCLHFLKTLEKKATCGFDDRRCELIKQHCSSIGIEEAKTDFATLPLDTSFEKSLYIRPFRVPMGNRYKILRNTSREFHKVEFLNPVLTVDDASHQQRCHLPLVSLCPLPWPHCGRIVSQTVTNYNIYTSEHFIYPWLRWSSAMHRYDIGELLVKLRAYTDKRNPPSDIMDYDRLPIVVGFAIGWPNPSKPDFFTVQSAMIATGEMANRKHLNDSFYSEISYGTARLLALMVDDPPIRETATQMLMRPYHELTFIVFRDVFIPRMRLRITRNFQRFATRSDVMEVYLYCKYPWLGKNEKYPPACKYYVENVWWTVTPEIPIATDRTQPYISTFRDIAVPSRKYSFIAKARWQYNRFYNLQITLMVSPRFDDSIDPIINTREHTHTLFNAYRVCFNDPVWRAFMNVGQIRTFAPDYQSVTMKIYQEDVLLIWLKRENRRTKYMCVPNFIITDAKIPHQYKAAYDVVMLDTYGQQTRQRVFLTYNRKEPLPIRYTLAKWKEFMERFRAKHPIEQYSDMNRPDTGLVIYSQLLTLRKMHHFSQSTAEFTTSTMYGNKVYEDIITVLETMNHNGLREAEQVITLCTYAAHSILLSEPTQLFHLNRIARIYDKVIFFLLKILAKPDPVQVGMATGDIIKIINPVLRLFEEILFRTPECKTSYCDIPNHCFAEEDFTEYVQLDQTKTEPMKDMAKLFYRIAKSLFSILVYYIESEQEPYYWSSTRRLLSVSFLNRAPVWQDRARYSVVYGPGFRARLPLMSTEYNVAVGLVTFKRNIFMEEGDCRINTTVNMMMSFADPVSHRFPYFGPLTVKHKLYELFGHSSWFAMKVITPAPPIEFVTGYTKDGRVNYHKILSVARYIAVIFPRTLQGLVKVAFSQWRHPTSEELYLRVSAAGIRIIIPKVQHGGPLIYMGVKSLEHETQYNFSVYSIDCLTYDLTISDWTNELCQPEEDAYESDFNLRIPNYVGCRCSTYNGIFGAQLFKAVTCPDIEYDLSALYLLFVTMDFEDFWPAVVMVLVVDAMIILSFIAAFVFGYFRNRSNRTVYFYRDNNLVESYAYTVAVETDFKPQAGTTANVILQVEGTDGVSMPFLLKDGTQRVLRPGLVVYFIMMTEASLGRLTKIRLTSDFSGDRPSWCCRSISVCDLEEGQGYLFYVNHWFCLMRSDVLTIEVPVLSLNMLPRSAALTLNYFSQYMRQDHPIIGAILRHPRSVVSSYQHISASGGTTCLMMAECTVIIKLFNLTQEDMLSDDNAISFIMAFVMSGIVALGGFGFNYILLKCFRTAGPNPKKHCEASQKACNTEVSVYGNKVFLALNAVIQKTGGVTIKRLYHVCSPPLIGRKAETRQQMRRMFNLYTSNEPEKEVKLRKVPNLVWVGWFMSFFTMIGGSLITIILCVLYFTEDRSLEVVFLFAVAFVLYVLVIGPAVLYVMSTISGRLLQEKPDRTGFNHKLVIPKFRTPSRTQPEDIKLAYINLRKYNPAYKPLSYEELAVRQNIYKQEVNHRLKPHLLLGSIVFSIYIFYLAYSISGDSFYLGFKSVYDVFITAKYSGLPAFTAHTKNDAYTYIQHTIFRGIRPELCDSCSSYLEWLSGGVHKVIGLPRLKQTRMNEGTCATRKPFSAYKWPCNAWFNYEEMSTRNYLPEWKARPSNVTSTPALRPYTFEQEVCPITHTGLASEYPYSGYGALIPMQGPFTQLMLKALLDNGWVDLRTRAIVFEVALYNTDANFLTYVVVVLERLPSGQFNILHSMEPARFMDKIDEADSVLWFWMSSITILFLYATYFIAKSTSVPMHIFWTEKWNIFDFVIISCSFVTIVIYYLRRHYTIVSRELIPNMQDKQYLNIHLAIYYDRLFRTFIAWIVFFGVLRMLKMLLNLRYFFVVSLAMNQAATALRSFCIMAVVMYMAFSFLGFIILSDDYEEYSTLWHSLFSCLTMTKGYFPIGPDELQLRGTFLSLIMYKLFVLLGAIFITKVFVAVIVSSYDVAVHSVVPYGQRRKRRLAWNMMNLGLQKMTSRSK